MTNQFSLRRNIQAIFNCWILPTELPGTNVNHNLNLRFYGLSLESTRFHDRDRISVEFCTVMVMDVFRDECIV